MVTGKRKIVWDNIAKQQLREAYNYIKKDSPKNAKKVRDDIIARLRERSSDPEIYAPDRYKITNDGTYRAFEKYHYRISYRVLENEIRIFRIRHTSREPFDY